MKIVDADYDSVMIDVREEQEYLEDFDLADLNCVVFYNKNGYISDDVGICLESGRIDGKFSSVKFIFPDWMLNKITDHFDSIQGFRESLRKIYKVSPYNEENGKKEFKVYKDPSSTFNTQVKDIIERLGKNLPKYQITFDKNEEWICIKEA